MSTLLAQFDERSGLYDGFRRQLETLLRQLVEADEINVHSISSRTKTRSSFVTKQAKKGSEYSDLGDVTDIVGLRVITYFADQVDAISRLIEREFQIDRENSIDKRESLDPDRFGYLSVHYVVTLPPARCLLTENKQFATLKAEIQIRSILQHSWAEIEHDLGYKSTGEVPNIAKRRFARLAGLLELADQEFMTIKNDIEKYGSEVSAEIVRRPEVVPLDFVSLEDLVKTDQTIARLDMAIAQNLRRQLAGFDLSGDVDKLMYFGLSTVAEVQRAIRSSKYRRRGERKMTAKSPPPRPSRMEYRSTIFATRWPEKPKTRQRRPNIIESFALGMTPMRWGQNWFRSSALSQSREPIVRSRLAREANWSQFNSYGWTVRH